MHNVDPAISVMGVPMPGHHNLGWLQMEAGAMDRALRIYMPRNYQQLIDEWDPMTRRRLYREVQSTRLSSE